MGLQEKVEILIRLPGLEKLLSFHSTQERIALRDIENVKGRQS